MKITRKTITTCAISAAAAAALAFALAGCASTPSNTASSDDADNSAQAAANAEAISDASDGSAAEAELENPADLQVTDFGWTVTDDGYVNFAVAIFNPNKYIEAEDPIMHIKVLDASNHVICDESTQISAIRPMSTYEMSYVANKDADGNQVNKDQIADVSIAVEVADDEWAAYDENDSDITTEINYAIANQNVVASDVDGVDEFQGRIAVLTDEGEAVNKLPDAVADSETIPTYVNIILYGLDGSIVAGYYDVYDVPLNGDVIDYSVYAFNAPEYNGYKVFVHPYDYEIG